jgi:hypothetical protein
MEICVCATFSGILCIAFTKLQQWSERVSTMTGKITLLGKVFIFSGLVLHSHMFLGTESRACDFRFYFVSFDKMLHQ